MFAKYKQDFFNADAVAGFFRGDDGGATVHLLGSNQEIELDKGMADALAKVLREQIKRDAAETVIVTDDTSEPPTGMPAGYSPAA